MNRLVFALVLSALAGACNSTPPAPPPPSADAWAVVGGREIKRADVEKAFRRTPQGTEGLSEDEALAAKLTLLNELIVQDMLLAKARELKIVLPDTEVDTRVCRSQEEHVGTGVPGRAEEAQPDA